MSYNTVNHSILSPVSITFPTPSCNNKTGMLSFDTTPAKPGEQPTTDIIGVETFTFKSMGMVATFSKKTVVCQLYWIDFKKMEIVSKESTYDIPDEYTTPSEIYCWLAGSILTDADKPLWLFNQGSGTRSKFGWILNHLICNGDIKPFSGKFGNKTLSLINRVVNITNVAGETVYQSRVTRLQKTLLKD